MAALTAPTAASDNSGSTARLVQKFFYFSSVADNDTFACPMANVKIAQFIPSGATPAKTSVEIGASSSGVTSLTINTDATVAGWLLVWGTGV